MNSIPSYVSDLLVSAFTNIKASSAVLEQTVTDTYLDEQHRLVKRNFSVRSAVWDGKIQICFKLDEILPTMRAHRMDIDLIDDVYADEALHIVSGDLDIVFAIREE